VDYLVDTSVLVRALLSVDPNSGLARRALATLLRENHTLVVLPQIVAEFWAVATRLESENGLGYTPERAERWLTRYRKHFQLEYETEAVYLEWRKLISDHQVRGKQTHDARIAAAVRAHGLERVLTFNTKHFERYNEISVIHPQHVSQEA